MGVGEQALVDSGATVIDGRTPLGGNVYTQTMPCLPDEGPAHGCDAGGLIAVRALDGVHFCNGPGACAGYSSGSRRYAQAITSAWLPPPTTTSSTTTTSTTSSTTTTSTTTI